MEAFREEFNKWIVGLYYVSLLLLAASIPLSKYTTSLVQFIIAGIWLLYESDIAYIENFRTGKTSKSAKLITLIKGFLISLIKSLIAKFSSFGRNKVALVITSLLLLHVTGVIYTSDFSYALKDLRTKIPLLLLPLFFSTGPKVPTRILYLILIGYCLAIFGGTLYRLYLYFSLPVADPRAFNPHISHIRFSLNAVFAIFILLYLIRLKNYFHFIMRLAFFLLIVWFIFVLFYLRYSTGISIFIIISIILLIYKSLQGYKARTRVIWLLAGLFLLITPILYISNVIRKYHHTAPIYFSALESKTSSHNSYYHDTVNFRIENGKYVGLYICDKELRKEWSLRSRISIDSLDYKQQPIRSTLIRYLASKDLRKDSSGIAQLTNEDILHIESGITNNKSQNGFDIYNQIDNFLIGWENYRQHGNPNSSSLIQRFEYWRTSLILISQHPLIGVGTGDVPTAFSEQYIKMNSSLDPQNRLRSHNQFLSITVAFGILGLAWFIFVLLYPMIKVKGYKHYFYIIFWIIFMISMLTEDTIETQEGVTFFTYFTSLFLLAWSREMESEENHVEKQNLLSLLNKSFK